MAIPRSIATALALTREPVGLPGEPAVEERPCEGARYHSPNPLRVHRVDLGLGREVMLCGTCRDNAAVLFALHRADLHDLPWRREFGNRLRALLPKGSPDG